MWVAWENSMAQARREGEERGRDAGLSEKAREIARRMAGLGKYTPEEIAAIVGLPLIEVNALVDR